MNPTDKKFLADFLAFAKAQPADMKYVSFNTQNCALAQFVRAKYAAVSTHADAYRTKKGFRHYPENCYKAAMDVPSTWGRLARRLANLLEDQS